MNTPDPAAHRDPSTGETPPDTEPADKPGADETRADETEADETGADTAPQEGSEAPESTAVFVRRRGGPTLVFWVLLCLAVPAVATLVIAPLLGVTGLSALLNLALVAMFGVGGPLAALCALIDAITHRKRR